VAPNVTWIVRRARARSGALVLGDRLAQRRHARQRRVLVVAVADAPPAASSTPAGRPRPGSPGRG
jgi:hypothetical protein